MTRRRGFTLLSMLVLITVGSTLIAVSGPMFHHLFRAQANALQESRRNQNLTRLSRQLRQDAHASTPDFALTPDGDELRLRPFAEPPEIVYRLRREGLDREVWRAGSVSARDTFQLPGCQLRFSRENSGTDGANGLLQLHVERPRSYLTAVLPDLEPTESLTIEVEVGRAQRLIKLAAPSEPTAEVP